MTAISDYNTACQQAQSALEAGQYATALQAFERAWAAQLRIPDSELDNEVMTFPRESIKEAITYCKGRAEETAQLNATTRSIQFSTMGYERG